jgi:di/tricarboxylate transporter
MLIEAPPPPPYYDTSETVVFICLVIVWDVGIISSDEALSGYSNPGTLAVGVLFVVVRAVQRSKLTDRLARRVLGFKTSARVGLLRLMFLCFVLSAFFNNTPLVALFIPIVRDWCRMRNFVRTIQGGGGWGTRVAELASHSYPSNEKFCPSLPVQPPSQFLMPLSFSCILGGVLTIVGTSTNLVVQGLLSNSGLPQFGFFEPAKVALPVGVVGIFLMAFTAEYLLPKQAGLFRFIRDRADELITEVEVAPDFKHCGQPLSLAMTRIGLPMEAVVKIRRPLAPRPDVGATQSAREAYQRWEATAAESANRAQTMAWGTAQKPARARSESPGRLPRSSHSQGETLYSSPVGARQHRLRRRAGSGSQETQELMREKRVDDSAPIFSSRAETEPSIQGLPSKPLTGRFMDIFPVSFTEVVQAGDIIFLSTGQKQLIEFHSTSLQTMEGLRLLDVEALDLPTKGTDFFELVISDHSRFVGEKVSDKQFADYFSCTVLAVRRRGAAEVDVDRQRSFSIDLEATGSQGRVADSEHAHDEKLRSLEVSLRPFAAGDTVLVLAREGAPCPAHSLPFANPLDVFSHSLLSIDFQEHWANSNQFLLVSKVGNMPKPVVPFDYVPLLFFGIMLAFVTVGLTEMVQAGFTCAAILVLGGWIPATDAVSYVDWGLLLLIGSSLGLSSAVLNSGMAGYIGEAIQSANMPAQGVVFLLYAVTSLLTELVTNTAAASLLVPIAIEIAKVTGISYRPLVFTVMMGASSSFLTPIGYQVSLHAAALQLVQRPSCRAMLNKLTLLPADQYHGLVRGRVLFPRFHSLWRANQCACHGLNLTDGPYSLPFLKENEYDTHEQKHSHQHK